MLDLQDIVVHIFTPEQREFYDLDGYYGLAEVSTNPNLISQPSFGPISLTGIFTDTSTGMLESSSSTLHGAPGTSMLLILVP